MRLLDNNKIHCVVRCLSGRKSTLEMCVRKRTEGSNPSLTAISDVSRICYMKGNYNRLGKKAQLTFERTVISKSYISLGISLELIESLLEKSNHIIQDNRNTQSSFYRFTEICY